jgi:hypothetical protein
MLMPSSFLDGAPDRGRRENEQLQWPTIRKRNASGFRKDINDYSLKLRQIVPVVRSVSDRLCRVFAAEQD